MKFSEWQTLRARLNHDCLKNRLAVATGKAESVIRGEVVDDDYIDRFVNELKALWPRLTDDVHALFDAFPAAVSSRRFFAVAPLSKCGCETLRWLPDAVDQLWIQRIRAEVLTSEAQHAFSEADAAAQRLVREANARDGETEAGMSDAFLHSIRAFGDACRSLSVAISAFPQRLPF